MIPAREARDRAHWEAVDEATELLREGAYEQALTQLRDVIKSDAHNPYAYYFTGVGLWELARLEPARDAFRAAVAISPGYVGARASLSAVLHALGDHNGALREGESALRIAPESPDALYAVGQASLALGDRDAASHYLERFLRTKPEYEVGVEVAETLELLRQGGATPE